MGISLVMVFKYNRYQQAVSTQWTTEVGGELGSKLINMEEYLALKEVNVTLNKENAELRNQLSHQTPEMNIHQPYQSDSVFEYIPAKVVSLTKFKQNNYLIINKGRKDGIEDEMGVISSNGVVGVVINVSENYATVMMSIHRRSVISARIQKNNQLVSLVWPGDDYRKGLVKDIPYHIRLNPGDTIITSGNSLLYPPDLKIGVISKQLVEEGGKLNNAEFIYLTDFKKLRYVYVVKNISKPEQQQLIDSIQNIK